MTKLPATKSDQLMRQGIAAHQEFRLKAAEIKVAAANAGWFFTLAKRALGHGSWLEFLANYRGQISQPTVWRYMQFTEELLRWAAQAHPEIDNETDLLQAGVEMALQSPRGLTGILRATGDMAKFGEYDPARYQAKKQLSNGGDRQVEFDFTRFTNGLRQLTELPELPAEPAQLDQLETDLEAALTHVRALKATIPV